MLVLALFFSCKTTLKDADVRTVDADPQISEILCRIKAPDQMFLQVNVQMTSVEGVTSPTALLGEWRVVTSGGAVFQTGKIQAATEELSQRTASITAKNLSARLAFNETPVIRIGDQVASCMVLRSQVSNASCNAIGTASQGWYANGKLLKHSRSCNSEVLACGNVESKEGWFVQKKINRVRIAQEHCAWRKEKPMCNRSSDGTSGWYLSDRLVARDDECDKKSIECIPSAKNEGWFTYRKSDPQLLIASGCNGLSPNQKTAKNFNP